MQKNNSTSNFEDKVWAVTHMPQPDPRFVDTLWGKMEAKTNQGAASEHTHWVLIRKLQGFFHASWQMGAALAGLAILFILLIFGMNLLPQNSRFPAVSQETQALSYPTGLATENWTASPKSTEDNKIPLTPTPQPASIPSRLIDGVCNTPISQAFNGQYLGRANQDNIQHLVGGGSADNGDFTFEIWLGCGSAFGRQAYVTSHYSEIEGLGLLIGWTYHGAAQEGDVVDYMGFEPFVRAHGSSSGALTTGTFNATISGVQFPAGIIPDFSQADTPLRYMIKVKTPDGKLAGAALTFTLQRQSDGYKPVNIQVSLLSEADLQTAASPLTVQPSFPTIDPETVYPELKAVRELVDRYQDPLRSSPGWLYTRTKDENPGGSGIYGGMSEWTSEAWLQIDASGYVISEVHMDRDANGQVLQQAYSKDGQTNNLTYGSGAPFTPYRFDIGSELYNSLFSQLQSGKPIDKKEITVEGRKAWAFAFTDTFTQPVSIDNVITSKLSRTTVIDQQSGAELYSELVRTTPDGQEQLVWRQTYETLERVEKLPVEALSILEQTPGPYQSLAPQGTPAPVGFDPYQSELTLQSIPGDDFTQPTFWYGDIYAGGYLLGRVNFGGSPDGYCARSLDGSKLAFNFLLMSNTSAYRESLRWLDLHDLTQVYDPAPDLELISKVTWSPKGSQLAFTACKTGHTACGLYLFDAGTNQVKLLSSAGVGFPLPVWKPDGSQIAFLTSDENNVYRLFVVDAVTGETYYVGLFNGDTWQAAADSPTNEWGVEISRGYTKNSCFITP